MRSFWITWVGPKSYERCRKRKAGWGGSSSLVVRWLGLNAFSAMARVQPLVRELRFHKPGDAGGRKKHTKILLYTY